MDSPRQVCVKLKTRVGQVDSSENWECYTAFFHDPDLPWTNNRTEQAIGKMKMSARTVRGYKTRSGMLNGLLVSRVTLT